MAAQPAEAASDPTRDASARVLFQEGVGLAEKGEWEAAEDRFRRALTLRASPVIAYNLASTLVERGKLIEASELLRKVEQDDKTDATMQRSVQSLQARLGQAHRAHPRQRARQTVERSRDARRQLAARRATRRGAFPVDPGPHRLSFTRGMQQLDMRDLKIAPGARRTVHAASAARADCSRSRGSVPDRAAGRSAADGCGSPASRSPCGQRHAQRRPADYQSLVVLDGHRRGRRGGGGRRCRGRGLEQRYACTRLPRHFHAGLVARAGRAMRRIVSRALALALAVAGAACGGGTSPLTQIVVVVDSDLSVPGELDAVDIEVSGGQAAAAAHACGSGRAKRCRAASAWFNTTGELGPVRVRVQGWLGEEDGGGAQRIDCGSSRTRPCSCACRWRAAAPTVLGWLV